MVYFKAKWYISYQNGNVVMPFYPAGSQIQRLWNILFFLLNWFEKQNLWTVNQILLTFIDDESGVYVKSN